MLEVICTFLLAVPPGVTNRDVVRAPGIAIKSDQEIWLVDLTWYMNKYPKYKEYNNLVQEVNGNECLVIK